MECPTDMTRYVHESTKQRQKDSEEVQNWILNVLNLKMHLVKETYNTIRYYNPTRLKEVYKVIQSVRQLIQNKNTGGYVSSDPDKYVEFRLVHQ
jgi:hypothetical protein